MTTYVSLAMSMTMFPSRCSLDIFPTTPEMVLFNLELEGEGIVSAVNKSHATTLDAIQRKFGIELPIPDEAPKVLLEPGDRLIVVQANLPRLNEGEVHSAATVEAAEITFRLVEVYEGL